MCSISVTKIYFKFSFIIGEQKLDYTNDDINSRGTELLKQKKTKKEK